MSKADSNYKMLSFHNKRIVFKVSMLHRSQLSDFSCKENVCFSIIHQCDAILLHNITARTKKLVLQFYCSLFKEKIFL